MTFAALLEESRAAKESWRYTRLDRFAKTGFVVPEKGAALSVPTAIAPHRIAFVDGRYDPSLSVLDGLPRDMVRPCDDQGGCCSLVLSNQTCLAIEPLELLFFSTDQVAANEAQTKIKVSLGENSRLTLLERHLGASSHCREMTMEITLSQQSKLIHAKTVVGAGLHRSCAQVSVAAGAFYDHFALVKVTELARCESVVDLNGSLAEARLLSLMLGREREHADFWAQIRHNAPHTTSRQIVKAVLEAQAHGVFQGLIHVAPGAQKTDGHQLCRAMLLSDKAEMDAKPELEIYADDVKCSHGTTIGDLDEMALFYLMSRGIAPQEARALLLMAFVMDVTDCLPAGILREQIEEEVRAWLR